MSLSGPVGTGIPGAYPLAINQPLDRAYLRPLQEPLYDSMLFDFTTPPSTLVFFQTPISGNTTAGSQTISKSLAETNINQSAMLDYPREFSILGFTVSFDSTIGLKSLGYILRRAYFQFTFSGRRQYLNIPLDRMPAGEKLDGAIAVGNLSANTANGSQVYSCFQNGIGHAANYYRFNLGRSALKIKPGEAFNASLNWPSIVPTGTGLSTQNNFYGQTPAGTAADPAGWWARVAIIGLSWQPL